MAIYINKPRRGNVTQKNITNFQNITNLKEFFKQHLKIGINVTIIAPLLKITTIAGKIKILNKSSLMSIKIISYNMEWMEHHMEDGGEIQL